MIRSTHLLERVPFLDALAEYLAEATAGAGRLVLLAGEAGIGKSSLVRAFCAAQRSRVRVLEGACDPLVTPRPLGPLFDVAPALSPGLSRLLGADARRAELFQVLLRDLSARLTLLVVEDVHWADEATLDVLRCLGRRVEAGPMLLVATYRDDELGAAHPLRVVLGDLVTCPGVRRLALPALSEPAVAALARDTGVDAGNLYRQTGGNPFFVTEVLAAGAAGIPPTVRDAVLARAARLSPTARRVLDAAAVIGWRVEPRVVDAVLGPDATGLDECVAVGVLRADGDGLAFRHELARQAIEEAIPPGRRRALHGAVLAALRQTRPGPDDLARLAHHAAMAGDRQAVLEFAPAAAGHATGLGANREAAAQYARALRFAAGLAPEALALLFEGRSLACFLTDDLDQAIAARRQAVELRRQLGDACQHSENLRWLARMLWVSGRLAEAEPAARATVQLLQTRPPDRHLALAYSTRAHFCMIAFRNAEAIHWGERALSLADQLGDTEVRLHALNNVGAARVQAGDARGWALLDESLRLARAAGFVDHAARAYFQAAQLAVWERQFVRADHYLDDGLAYCAEPDLDIWHRFLLAWRARSLFHQGRWAEAEELARWSLRRGRSADMARIRLLVVLGQLQARRGDPAAAATLDEALALVPDPEVEWLVPVRAARAEAAWLAGDHQRAVAEARLRFDPAIAERDRWAAAELLHWLWQAGCLDTEPLPASLPEPYALELARDWAAAAARWRELQCPYEAAEALAHSDDESALREALEVFEALGARPATAHVLRRLRERGARGLPRGPRPSTRRNAARLTPRETEVLRLVGEGLRNAEIAARLVVSERTAEQHVAAILGKLGVHSRVEAAHAAARLLTTAPR